MVRRRLLGHREDRLRSLVVPAAPAGHAAGRERPRLDQEPDRRVRPGPPRARGDVAVARGRQGDPDPPRQPRPARLPPTLAEVDAFLADDRPDAYERLVDRLLASPHFGECWGRHWLDKARYADTNGYEKDRERSIWPYRDWVIRALNADMPFDRFTIEQIAGDLLPNATASQKAATGFHRNTMTNEEGGIDVEEFRFASVVDRVATTGTVWLGLTVGCAQCHSHKYDPISQREYYGFFAFLDNADEPEIDLPDPAIAAAPRRDRARGRAARGRPEGPLSLRGSRQPQGQGRGVGEDDQADAMDRADAVASGLEEARDDDRAARRLGAGLGRQAE